MPITTRADGDVITASSWNANVRDQVVSTTTSGARPSGTEGQFIVETDTDLVQVYSGAAWVPFGGYGAWTSYTPTVTQSGAVTKTVTYARYFKIGRTILTNVRLDFTGAGTANNGIAVTTPVTASTAGLWVGSGVFYDASATTIYPVHVAQQATTFFEFTDSTAGTTVNIFTGQTGAAFSAAIASGDAIMFSAVYEAAA